MEKIDTAANICLSYAMNKKRIWASLHPFFEGGGVLGRGVANAGFLTALMAADPFDEYHFFLPDEVRVKSQQEALHSAFPAQAGRGAFHVVTRHTLPDAVRRHSYACFHLSDYVADTVPLMRLRAALCSDGQFFPITGPTHSLSYARYAPYFFSQLWTGVSPRDAMIVTSRTAEEAMTRYAAAFRRGYGLADATFPGPRLERIPLGVDAAGFPAPEEKNALGAPLRAEWNMAPDDCVFLLFARISHYSKMDMLPLLRALGRAHGLGLAPDRYTLVVAGWVEEGDEMPATYARLAAALGIRLRVVPSPSDTLRKQLFAAADVFVSPVDNPQETFGLSLLEAGVSGLPAVASDFDGYRDIVVDGETGVLIPTFGPGATPESDALSGIWFDNQYHLQLAQQSVVDVPALAATLVRLAKDAALRRRMGEAARARVLDGFTWSRCVERHMELWTALAAEPLPESRPDRPGTHPLYPGYTEIFGGYYSALVSSPAVKGLRVRWSRAGEAVYRGQDFPVIYAGIARLVSLEGLKRLLFAARKPVFLADLLPSDAGRDQAAYEEEAFLVLWALKQDFLERVDAGNAACGSTTT